MNGGFNRVIYIGFSADISIKKPRQRAGLGSIDYRMRLIRRSILIRLSRRISLRIFTG